MKKIGIIAGIFIVAIVIGIYLIRVNKVDTDVTKNETKVGVILNGSREDRSWGQSHYEALEATAKKLNLDITYMECVSENENSAEAFEKLAGEGCKIIIANSFGFSCNGNTDRRQYVDLFRADLPDTLSLRYSSGATD